LPQAGLLGPCEAFPDASDPLEEFGGINGFSTTGKGGMPDGPVLAGDPNRPRIIQPEDPSLDDGVGGLVLRGEDDGKIGAFSGEGLLEGVALPVDDQVEIPLLEVVERPEDIEELSGQQVHALVQAGTEGGNPVKKVASVDEEKFFHAEYG
jgi:hypothetical protein